MLKLRPINEADHNYVISTFQHGGASIGTGVPKPIITGLFVSCLTRWGGLVGCDDSEPTEIIGWVVFKPGTNIIAWVYVRSGFRGKDLGKLLTVAATPDTTVIAPFLDTRYAKVGRSIGIIHRPFACHL